MKITSAYTRDQFAAMEALGRQIVPDFYSQYLPPAVGDYLVESSHTMNAFETQVGEGYRHYMVEMDGRAVGYFALHEEERTMVLTQFYLLKEFRGKGIGQRVMDFIHREAKELRVRQVQLLVLRKNESAVGLYKKNGFFVAAEVMTRLDGGYALEDYLMQKRFDKQ